MGSPHFFLRTNFSRKHHDFWTKMVNWQDPALLLRDYRAYALRLRILTFKFTLTYCLLVDLTKLLHAVGGLYMYVSIAKYLQKLGSDLSDFF